MNLFCKIYEVNNFQVLVESIIDERDKPAISIRWYPEDGFVRATDYKMSFDTLLHRDAVFENMNKTFVMLMMEKCQHHINVINGRGNALSDINVGWFGIDVAAGYR